MTDAEIEKAIWGTGQEDELVAVGMRVVREMLSGERVVPPITEQEAELEGIEVEYLIACEDGNPPTLEQLIGEHPQFKDELIEFVLTAHELRSVMRQEEVSDDE